MREILTLLRANIKKQKSTFISVALLTLIVTSVMTAIISTEDNYKNGMKEAVKTAGSGDAIVMISNKSLTDELKGKIEESALTGRINYYSGLRINGISFGNLKTPDICVVLKLREGIKLYTSDLNKFEKEIPALQTGEVYLPLGLKGKINCNVGDAVVLSAVDEGRSFTVKGFVQEPDLGAQTVGIKQIFISDDDFDMFSDLWKPIEDKSPVSEVNYTLVDLHMADGCNMTSAKFLRSLNLETKITDNGRLALSREQSVRYSTLLPEVLIKLFSVFVIFLFVIVLILISHSISTEISSGYVTFGILKSVGFSCGKLTGLFFIQYLAAELLGIILGIALSVPLELTLSSGCKLITGVMPAMGISVLKALLLIAIIIAATSLVIFIKTLPLNKISPVKAIGGGKEDVYFDSRLQMPISKRFLTASLAFRQFTSAKRRYISIVFISLILVFFMLTVNLIINLISSNNALNVMGTEFADVAVYVASGSENAETYISEADDFVNSLTEVTQTYRSSNTYLSINGEKIYGHIVKDPESLRAIIKGRAPLYDNEIIITEMVGDALEIAMGDEVAVSFGEYDGKYIVSGIFQTTFDSGMCITMSEAAINRIIENDSEKIKISNISFSLENSNDAERVLKALREKYEGNKNVSVDKFTIDSYIGIGVFKIMSVIQAVIYFFSALFALVAVRMVTSRTFLQEKREIGIYKAMGFSSGSLRISFGIRFMTAAAIGIILGVIMSMQFSSKLLGLGLRLIGLSKVPSEFSAASVIVPVVILLMCFFVFAFLCSSKVKKVHPRELVAE